MTASDTPRKRPGRKPKPPVARSLRCVRNKDMSACREAPSSWCPATEPGRIEPAIDTALVDAHKTITTVVNDAVHQGGCDHIALHMPPGIPNPTFGRGTRASIARILRDLRTRGKVIWPWPPSIVIDDRDVDIETYLAAAMNYIKALLTSDMPRCEQDRTSLRIAYGLIENGLRLSQARRMGSGET